MSHGLNLWPNVAVDNAKEKDVATGKNKSAWQSCFRQAFHAKVRWS